MRMTQIAGIVLLAVFSTLAYAGQTQSAPVMLELQPDGSGMAAGDMVTARFSDNDVEFIGCGVRIVDDGLGFEYKWGFCQVADSADNRGFCSTMNATLVDAMQATSDYSFITFSWNAAGECDYVGFSTQSFYIPEKASAPGRSGR